MSSLANVVSTQSAQVTELLAQLADQQLGERRLAQPVAIVGPGDGGPTECLAAYRIAYSLAQAGLILVCGGRSGVMEAASRAAQDAGGIMVGLLPEDDAQAANPYLGVALPTGMGEMRNALIARCCLCMVAVGGGMGTISEVALGIKLGKPVFCMHEEVGLKGSQPFGSTDELLKGLASWLLQLT
jgi:uncharacterized protein (TIGR00725 family)